MNFVAKEMIERLLGEAEEASLVLYTVPSASKAAEPQACWCMQREGERYWAEVILGNWFVWKDSEVPHHIALSLRPRPRVMGFIAA